MRLQRKLLLGFLVSPVFFFGHSMAAWFGLRELRADVLSLQRFVQSTDLVSQTAAEMAKIPHPEDIEVGVVRVRSRPGETPVILTLLIERCERARLHIRSLRDLVREPRSRETIDETLGSLEDYRASAISYAKAIQKQGPEGAGGSGRQGAIERYERLSGAVNRFVRALGAESRRAVLGVGRRLNRQARIFAGTSFGVLFLLTVGTAFLLASVSVRELNRLLKAVRRIEAGNLDVEVEVRTEDEIGELSHAFNDMTRRLREIYLDLEERVAERTRALRQRETDLARTQKLAALGRLSAGVAHELGGPLTVIANAAEGLRDRALDPELAKLDAFEDFPDYLELIETEAFHLKKVIRRLLDYARPKSPQLLPIRFEDVAHNAVELARLDRRARACEISWQVEDRRSFMIQGDADRLQEAVMNLLFNALDAVGGAGEVRASLHAEEGEAVLRVKDTGHGIPQEQLSQIFEPFFTTKPEGVGTGLGLALVQGTVDAHAGVIRALSDGPGNGATFEIRLPLLEASEPEEHADVVLD